MEKSNKKNTSLCFYKYLLYVLPVVLFFSYYPVITLGTNENMNFELSLPLIWLMTFDLTGLVMMVKREVSFKDLRNKWAILLLLIWLTLSVIWSVNVTRGVLTAGIMWLIVFAVYIIWRQRELLEECFRSRWLKWFLYSALIICGWCVIQCVLDLVGVSREHSLMCEGCTYQMFGFPHPNGFAVEPQFMGNLLLAPTLMVVWLYVKKFGLRFLCPRILLLYLFIFAATLFLTFSRGAIYAFVVGMLFMSGFVVMRAKKGEEQGKVAKKMGITWGIVVLSFLFTLNLQGIMAEVSLTNDTYATGVAKVLNHLSLGVIDIKGKDSLPVENPVENFEDERETAVFDGYVEQSTEIRVKLTNVAITTWSKNLSNALFGVGLGGAGQALYENNLSPSPKEIVQNEYASLLLETGIIGISLLLFTCGKLVFCLRKNAMNAFLFSLAVTYGISLMFFSGLPNALHIYLLPVMFYIVLRKKLVS